jgi:hypothetical protein
MTHLQWLAKMEVEWLASKNPESMLDFLRGHNCVRRMPKLRGDDEQLAELWKFVSQLEAIASERKLRLFAVACCRRIESLLATTLEHKAIEVVEGVADGKLPPQERTKVLRSLTRAINRKWGSVLSDEPASYPAGTVWAAVGRRPSTCAWAAATWAIHAVAHNPNATRRGRSARTATEKTAQAHLLRCVMGNPFHPVAGSRLWFTRTVVGIAESIYADRAFDRLPILADALEDAGCDNADILNHCRQPGEHVRGCWVVDLVLGKE